MMAKIQEVCIYNRNVLCGGVVERYKRCWMCHWNPSAGYKAPKHEKEPPSRPKPETRKLSEGELWLKAEEL